MFKKSGQRGFTLIELLVVIAIIGILAATVLASLGSARSSGADAKIKQQLASFRAQAEITYTNTGSYATACTDGSTLLTVATGVVASCFDESSTWVVHTPLSVSGKSWCSDHTGASRQVTTTAIAATPTACPVAS